MKILVISGQLGTGKTTRLNNILGQISERKLTTLCIVNDVGTRNIDIKRVRSVGDVVPLTTGCICCESIESLKETLEASAKRSGLDLIIIEPTGIANATSIRQIASEIGLDWNCLCLVDVKHFRLNQAIGMDQFQLPAATAIGLTWAEDITDLRDEMLEPILEHIGHFSPAPIRILGENEAPLLENLIKETPVLNVCGCVHRSCIHQNHNEHKHHEHDHHQHIFATSIEFTDGVNEGDLLQILVDLHKKHGLIRGKGSCERIGDHTGRHNWDFVQGSIVWGEKTEDTPGGNFISSEEDLGPYLKFMCRNCDNNKIAVEQMDVFTDSSLPVETTIEAIDHLLSQYPNPVTKDGLVLTNCDADPAKHLARRPGVPREVHERAYRRSVYWRIEGFSHLVKQWETKVWPDDYSFYRSCFILGKALINTLEIDWVNELMDTEIREKINSLPTTELTFLGWEWMIANKPTEIADNLKVESVYRVLRYGTKHGLDQKKAQYILGQTQKLFKDYRPDYNQAEWTQVL